MPSTGRKLRSSTKQSVPAPAQRNRSTALSSPPDPLSTHAGAYKFIPRGSGLPNLSPAELTLLRKKQARLSSNTRNVQKSLTSTHLRTGLAASLIFAQHEAGSAVCIDPAGWVITCAHCFGDTEEEYEASSKRRWLLFYDGRAVQVECRVWDGKRDIALLKIVAIEWDVAAGGNNTVIGPFPFVRLCPRNPAAKTRIICIGQPGSEDLESATAAKTDYNLIEVSEGILRGMVPDADPQDNSEIGTLKHDAWTYWGHSGAPLLREADGALVGLHSSWDDQTCMRHGVPLVAIEQFLKGCQGVINGQLARDKTLSDSLERDKSEGGEDTTNREPNHERRAGRVDVGSQKATTECPGTVNRDVILISSDSDSGDQFD
ncbi:hypothetical protein FQN50_001397 [Emmonsiellopsis sp. PD_5]|nr:hypothetical protein FQN50_001397 [Emmonsiellopsis sp. PD_5]